MLDRWISARITTSVVLAGIIVISLISTVIVGALAQAPGQIKLNSLVGPLGIGTQGPGPTSSYLPVHGGTFTCGSGTATVSNTNVDAGSAIIITLKTVGGTVASLFIATITPATGFTVTCGGSDTSTYNYVIIG